MYSPLPKCWESKIYTPSFCPPLQLGRGECDNYSMAAALLGYLRLLFNIAFDCTLIVDKV